jgi:DNA-binding XRE family transcriptional regulator
MAKQYAMFYIALMENQQKKENPLGIDFNHEAWKAALPKTISRRKLAKAIGTTDSNLIAIEKGNSKPSILLAFCYCDFTHLDIAELCLKK